MENSDPWSTGTSIDPLEVAREAIAAPGWEWLEGSLTLPFYDETEGAVGRTEENQVHPGWRVQEAGVSGPWSAPEQNADALPDFKDPPTMGCLLFLVRQAWNSPRIHASALLKGGWAVWILIFEGGNVSSCMQIGQGLTEAAALVAALKAASQKSNDQT